MFQPLGSAGLSGAAKSLSGADPAAKLAQASEKKGRTASEDRKSKASKNRD